MRYKNNKIFKTLHYIINFFCFSKKKEKIRARNIPKKERLYYIINKREGFVESEEIRRGSRKIIPSIDSVSTNVVRPVCTNNPYESFSDEDGPPSPLFRIAGTNCEKYVSCSPQRAWKRPTFARPQWGRIVPRWGKEEGTPSDPPAEIITRVIVAGTPPRPGRVLNKYNTRVIWQLGERLTGAVDPVCTPSIARGCLSSPPPLCSRRNINHYPHEALSLSPFLFDLYIYIYLLGWMASWLTYFV